ncbi:21344_t:CDS:1, partial [Rhizophagus irregularis]
YVSRFFGREILSWMPRIFSLLPPTANLKNDIISPLVYDYPSCDDPVNDDPSPLPLTI